MGQRWHAFWCRIGMHYWLPAGQQHMMTQSMRCAWCGARGVSDGTTVYKTRDEPWGEAGKGEALTTGETNTEPQTTKQWLELRDGSFVRIDYDALIEALSMDQLWRLRERMNDASVYYRRQKLRIDE